MSKKNIEKRLIDLSSPEKINVITYGGAFDIANGSVLPINDIKFQALFYEHILVHDAYFSCYGPLFQQLSKEKDAPIPARWISKLLTARAIVPAIRNSDSMLSVWRNGSHGIRPGELASVEIDEGDKVLSHVDEVSAAYASWPDDMASANTIAFPELLRRLISSPENPLGDLVINTEYLASLAHHYDIGSVISVRRLIDDFRLDVETNANNPKYRRGDIERLIWKHVSSELPYDGPRPFDPWIYCRLEKAINISTKVPLLLAAAAWLLTLVTTAYEIYHSCQYKTIASLFPQHSESLVATGIYDQLKELRQAEYEMKVSPLLSGTLDISKLTVNQIIKIRETEEFQEYIRLLKYVRPAAKGESFYNANENYVNYLLGTYVPLIIKTYPNAGWVAPVAKISGIIAGSAAPPLLALIESMNNMTVFSLSNYTLMSSVAGGLVGGAMEQFSGGIEKFVNWSRRNSRSRQFSRRNRYGLFVKS